MTFKIFYFKSSKLFTLFQAKIKTTGKQNVFYVTQWSGTAHHWYRTLQNNMEKSRIKQITFLEKDEKSDKNKHLLRKKRNKRDLV